MTGQKEELREEVAASDLTVVEKREGDLDGSSSARPGIENEKWVVPVVAGLAHGEEAEGSARTSESCGGNNDEQARRDSHYHRPRP